MKPVTLLRRALRGRCVHPWVYDLDEVRYARGAAGFDATGPRNATSAEARSRRSRRWTGRSATTKPLYVEVRRACADNIAVERGGRE